MNGHKKPIIASTPPETIAGGVPFLKKEDFDKAVFTYGYEVTHEKALRCPCTNKGSGNALTNCQNCGGLGWFFINKRSTRMLIQNINKSNQFKNWTQDDKAKSSISARPVDKLAFMDRVTVLDVLTYFSESKKTMLANNEDFAFLYYYPLEVEFVFLFVGVNQKLLPLVQGSDFQIVENKIIFDSDLKQYYGVNETTFNETGQFLNFTIKYSHNPSYNVTDITREAILNRNSSCETGLLKLKDFPVHSMAMKTHYLLDPPDFNGDSVFDNSTIIV